MDEFDFDDNPNLLEEYEILDEISEGSFGVVYRARHKRSDEIVAVKEEFHRHNPSTSMEIKILKSLPPHPNIVQFKGVATHRAHAFLIMEYLEHDLQRLRVAQRRPFSLMEIKCIMREMLKGVKFLHDNGIMHRDLKPANILVGRESNNRDTRVKICDFGMSARVGAESGGMGTRFYRAPEVLSCSGKSYTGAVDMWSVGCVMAEMALDKPLFQGRSDADQLACIRGVLCATRKASSFLGMGRLGVDLMERFLAYHPSNRISAMDALNHPWFKEDPLLLPLHTYT